MALKRMAAVAALCLLPAVARAQIIRGTVVAAVGRTPIPNAAVAARVARTTATADRLWAALPLFSTAETWGDSLHFELPIETGRERGARLNGELGEVYFWADDDRILIAFGPTPISRPNEIRLPRPCNVLARTQDDVRALKAVTPGEKVSVRRAGAT